MQHLFHNPLNVTLSLSLLRVPYLTPNVFENEAGTFLDFSEAHGYSLVPHPHSKALTVRQSENNFLRNRMFMQEWGFFRLLSEAHAMIHAEFDRRQWTQDDGIQEVEVWSNQMTSKVALTTRLLPRLGVLWARARLELPQHDVFLLRYRLAGYVEKARNLAVHFCNRAEKILEKNMLLGTPGYWQFLSIFISVIVVCEYLQLTIIGNGIRMLWINSQKPFIYSEVSQHKFIEGCFIRAGWCPVETRILLREYSFSLFMALSFFNRRELGRQHSKLEGFPSACSCEIVNRELLRPVHADGCSDCGQSLLEAQWAKVDSEVLRIVTDNKVPLLSIRQQNVNGRELAIDVRSTTSASSSTPFIAISHLWSDGLGPGIHNRIPACQMLRVARLVNLCSRRVGVESLPFWLDSICVPLSSPQIGDRARQMMAWIYQSASAVIALDSEFENADMERESAAVVLARVAFSRWATRGWTFQEGAYARRLFFLLGSSLVTYDDLELANQEQVLSSVPEDLVDTLDFEQRKRILESMNYGSSCFFISKRHLDRFSEWMKQSQNDNATKLGQIWKTINNRVVSHSSDEALIVSGLLGSSIKLDQIDGPDRMKALFTSFTEIPDSMLFHVCERYKEPGLRWIPRSMMRCNLDLIQKDFRWDSRTWAKVSPDGAEISSEGILINLPKDFTVNGSGLMLSFENNKYWFSSPIYSHPLRLTRLTKLRSSLIGVIFPPKGCDGAQPGDIIPGTVLLVGVRERRDTTLICDFDGLWNASRMSMSATIDLTDWLLVDGNRTDQGQKWCIG